VAGVDDSPAPATGLSRLGARLTGVTSLLVMGVSGSGKTTIGQLLSARLGIPFLDADDLHSPENVAKMAAGIPLTDADRGPWLTEVAGHLAQAKAEGRSIIVGCSALKRAYRDLLRDGDPALRVVYLRGTHDQLASRLVHRVGHFFPPTLLAAQLADLEEPGPDEHPTIVPIGGTPEETVEKIAVALAG